METKKVITLIQLHDISYNKRFYKKHVAKNLAENIKKHERNNYQAQKLRQTKMFERKTKKIVHTHV